MIPLCNVDGVASVLFTKRSGRLRAHKNEICFPGGKVTDVAALRAVVVVVATARLRQNWSERVCTSVTKYTII